MIAVESFFTLIFIVMPALLVDQWLPAVFPTILEISLTTGLVAGALLLLRPLLKKHYRAKWMYWVWLLLAVRLVVPVNVTLPNAPVQVSQSNVSVYRLETRRTNPGFASYVLLSPEERARAVQQEADAVKAGAHETGGDIYNEYLPALTLTQIVAALWGVGFSAALLWEGVSYARFRRRVHRWRKEEDDPFLLARFEALKAELGVKKLTLARCSAISSPMVTGFRKPVLLLPERREQAPALQGESLEAVLRHELVHAKRRDLWYKLLLVFARAVHWFNPLVWLLARQASQDLELSCDEAVVASRDEGFRADYGRAILDAVDSGKGRENAPLTTYFHGGKKAMLERLQSIVNTKGKRRGAIALTLVAILAVSASAVCAIVPPVQQVDGAAYALRVPTDISCVRTEAFDEGFISSYYNMEFFRDGEGIGRADLRYLPGYGGMTDAQREAALRDALHLPELFTCTPATAPNGMTGLLAQNGHVDHWFFSLGDGQVLKVSFNYGAPNDDLFVRWFTRAEADAALSSLTVGYTLIPAPKGTLALSYSFGDEEMLWHLWDMGGYGSKLLGTATVPARHRILGGLLWSEDGRWAAVPSSDGDLKWNWRIFGVGKEGFTENSPVVLDPTDTAMLSQDYTPVPHTMELHAIKFINVHGNYPTLALTYSLMDTEGRLQSGTLNYSCVPPQVSVALTGFTPVTHMVGNVPLVPTQWADEIHSFSLLLPEGTNISPASGEGVQIFTTSDGTELGRIYKTAEPPLLNSGGVRVHDGAATYMYAWRDSAHSLYYHLELHQPDSAAPPAQRMVDALTMDGASVTFFYATDSKWDSYTQADVDSAMEAARSYFAENQTRQLDKLWFDPEKLSSERNIYINYGRGARNGVTDENIMVLFCNFSFTGDPPNYNLETRTDWKLIFIRESANAPWVLDDQGY